MRRFITSIILIASVLIVLNPTDARADPFLYTFQASISARDSLVQEVPLWGSFVLSDPLSGADSYLDQNVLYSLTDIRFRSDIFGADGTGSAVLDYRHGEISFFGLELGDYVPYPDFDRPGVGAGDIWAGWFGLGFSPAVPPEQFGFQTFALGRPPEYGTSPEYLVRQFVATRSATVPEPAALLLVGLGLVGLLVSGRPRS